MSNDRATPRSVVRDFNMYLFVFVVCLSAFCVECKKKEAVQEVFDVKPGGTQHQFEHKAVSAVV